MPGAAGVLSELSVLFVGLGMLMPPLYPRELNPEEVEWLLPDSEGRKSAHEKHGNAGHADAKHHAITKDGLWGRRDTDKRFGAISLLTAFVSRADMAAALRETLDSVEGKWARLEFSQGAPTRKWPKGSHDGMWAKIYFVGRCRVLR